MLSNDVHIIWKVLPLPSTRFLQKVRVKDLTLIDRTQSKKTKRQKYWISIACSSETVKLVKK